MAISDLLSVKTINWFQLALYSHELSHDLSFAHAKMLLDKRLVDLLRQVTVAWAFFPERNGIARKIISRVLEKRSVGFNVFYTFFIGS